MSRKEQVHHVPWVICQCWYFLIILLGKYFFAESCYTNSLFSISSYVPSLAWSSSKLVGLFSLIFGFVQRKTSCIIFSDTNRFQHSLTVLASRALPMTLPLLKLGGSIGWCQWNGWWYHVVWSWARKCAHRDRLWIDCCWGIGGGCGICADGLCIFIVFIVDSVSVVIYIIHLILRYHV